MTEALPAPAREWALFLDVDGTLLDIAATPDAVTVPPGLRDLLRALDFAMGHALALVSGRSLADLDRIFAPVFLPAAGQHGAELRLAAVAPVIRMPVPPRLGLVRRRLERFLAARPRVLVEDKGCSIALHFRNAEEQRDELYRLALDAVAEDDAELELLPTRKALDIKARGPTKGSAVEWFMRTGPFRGRVPVFIGDDLSDEDGFAAALRLSGHAIRIGEEGESVAPLRLRSPAELRRWLAAIVAALRRC